MLIVIHDLRKIYRMGDDEVRALDGVDLEVERGEYLAIMGPSGSGKSTLMNLIGCLDTPSSGEYVLNGERVSGLDDSELARIRNREIGFVFQTFNLLPRATALANVELPLIYRGLSPAKRRPLVEEAIESVGLTDRAHHRPSELSGGQRQRIAIARALVHGAKLLVFDEATTALDPESEAFVLAAIEALRGRATVLAISHQPALTSVADRIYRITDGKCVEVEAAKGSDRAAS